MYIYIYVSSCAKVSIYTYICEYHILGLCLIAIRVYSKVPRTPAEGRHTSPGSVRSSQTPIRDPKGT